MSSIKVFKKNINNSIGHFIEKVYAWELDHPDTALKSTDKLIDNAIILFDDMIEKIHQIRRKRGKEDFKSLKDKLDKAIDALQKELDKLG